MFFKLPNEPEGRFYDNIRVGLHGQSTSGFGKKAQNVNFNADNRFHWSTGESEISTMNLLSNYSDKTKVRNKMAWDFWNRTRHPSHWCQMVRVQQVIPSTVNAGVAAQFYGLWDMTEDGNSDFLKRWGLDENGALYKCYNSLDNARQTTSNSSGVEKKTREWENFSDLQALVTALNPANALNNRRQWTYDNVDVPALINLLAVHAFIRSNDYGIKTITSTVTRTAPRSGRCCRGIRASALGIPGSAARRTSTTTSTVPAACCLETRRAITSCASR